MCVLGRPVGGTVAYEWSVCVLCVSVWCGLCVSVVCVCVCVCGLCVIVYVVCVCVCVCDLCVSV